MRASTFALTLLLATPTIAQDLPDRLVAAALADHRAYDTLAYLTDNIGPRFSGTRNAELAVQWTTKQFRDWGISVRNEKVMVPRWQRGVERARLVSHRNQHIVLTTLGGSVATPADGITAPVIEVRSFEELAQLGRKNVAGKIVLYNKPMDMAKVEAGRAFEAYSEAVVFRGAGASRAAEFGAIAALVRSVGSASLRTPHTGAMRYDPKFPKIPTAAVTSEDADLISRLLKKGERVRMHLVLTPKTLPEVESANVVAEIRGSELPDEIVLIGAHLDSWDVGTGAIDNGSGVAMVMQTMRLFKELGIRPRRTVRCVLFMNEENGLRGGRGYFAAHKNEKHVAAIESDAGAAKPSGYLTTLSAAAIEELTPRVRALQRVGALHFEHAEQTGADTSPLVEAGVPGFGLVPNPRHYFDYHHTPADTLDKVDPGELAENVAAVAVLTYAIADDPRPLPK